MDQTWWDSLSSIEHVYWIIATIASTILAIQLIIACTAGLDAGIGGHGDHDVHHDFGEPHFQLLTVRGIVAFFALFGWSGLAFYHQGMHSPLIIALSMLCGFIMMVITAAIFYGLSTLQSSGNVDYSLAKNLLGNVYMRIPSVGEGGHGIIKVILQNKIVEMEAVTKDGKEIIAGNTVKILETTNTVAVVERV